MLDPIGSKTVNELSLLEFTISANDSDGDSLTYSATGLPAGAIFDPANRTFSWTPGLNQQGDHIVTFQVNDSNLTDSEDVTITVGNVNQAPVLDPIGSKTVNELSLLEFTISANDSDGDSLTYSATGLPAGAIFDPANRTFSWTPGLNQQGDHIVTFQVNDSNLTDSEDVTITVGNVNQAPVLVPIGNKSVNELTLLEFTISATDSDGDSLTYSATGLPTGAIFDPANRTFSWTPGLNQQGDHIVTFQVNDSNLTDSEDVTITVGNVNQAPVLDPIGSKTVNELSLLEFTISANDSDGDSLTYSATGLPAGAIFDPANRTFSWTPGLNQQGDHIVTFQVNDSNLTDSEDVTITVGNVNQAPVLDPIGSKTVNELSLLEFTISANDSDGDSLTYSATGLPAGAIFDPANRTFSWTPGLNQQGDHIVTFQVNDSNLTDSEDVTITVGNVNQAPVLVPIGNKSVNELTLLEFTISATDSDGDSLTYSATGLPTGAIFDPANRTFSWTPGLNQQGDHIVTFQVNDSNLTDSEDVTITVGNVNQAPVLDPIGSKTVNELSLLEFTISANDSDGDSLTYSATGLPAGAIFDPANRTFSWTPGLNQQGDHIVTFQVNDSNLTDSEDVTITVGNVNQAPVLDPIGSKTVNELSLLEFTISATDSDGDSLTYSATGLPAGAIFDPANRTFSWTPGLNQQGDHIVTFQVNDSNLTDSEDVTITVGNVNQAPVLDPIGSKTVNELSLLEFTISATDSDNDLLTYSATGLPTGATFDPANRTFSWTPGLNQQGDHIVTFQVNDSNLTDSEDVTITVGNVNQAPVLDPIGSKTVNELTLLEFTISANDSDGDSLTYSATGLPAGAIFDPANRTFSWTPGLNQQGDHIVTFQVNDSNLTDSEDVTITVGNVNQAPVLDPIGSKTVNELSLLEFTISANDSDGDSLTYSATGLPAGAIFDPANRTFSWTPGLNQQGDHIVTFQVNDSNLTDSEDVTITVGNVNQAPVLVPIGNKSVNELSLLEFTISANDSDGDSLTYSATGLPAGAIFDPANRTFSWTPGLNQQGDHIVTFQVNDSNLTDSEDVTITVGNVNQAPVLDPIGSKTVNELSLLEFTISANDSDGDSLTYSATGLPAGAIFDPANRTFSWTPGLNQQGDHIVTFQVNDSSLTDSEDVTITVGNVNQAPQVTNPGTQTNNERTSVSWQIIASDPDGDAMTYTASNLPPGLTINTTGFISGTLDYDSAGTYSSTVTVTDPSGLNNSATFTWKVLKVIVSDDFSAPSLNTSLWTIFNPRNNDATFSIVGTGTKNALLNISIPAGLDHDVWNTNNAPRVMQNVSDIDFEIEVKFQSQTTKMYQIQGVIIQQDLNNFIRFDIFNDGTSNRKFAASTLNGASTSIINQPITGAFPYYIRVKRVGDQWAMNYSSDGKNWTTGYNFAYNLNVTSVGPFVGNAGGGYYSPPPSYNGLIDYFFNTNSPIVPEDPATFGLSGYKVNASDGKGISGWNISITNGSTTINTSTNNDGFYQFTNLENGTYTVSEEERPYWKNISARSVEINVTEQDITNINFTNQPIARTYKISGYTINASDNTGISGWNITITNGSLVTTMSTGTNGYYEFTNLINGSYTVSEELVIGWTNVSLLSQNITIIGQNQTKVNFTNLPISTFNVSGYKINASDNRGISGWNITIKNSQIQTSNFTDANGFYQFTNVARGPYTIFEEQQSEWTNVTPASREITLDRDLLVNFTNKPLAIVSDDFSDPELNTALWTIIDPQNDSTFSIIGNDTKNATLSISVPDTSQHGFDNGNHDAPRIMQRASNKDFEIEVKFQSKMTSVNQMEGLIIQQDNNKSIRFDFEKDWFSTNIMAVTFDNDSNAVMGFGSISDPSPDFMYMRVKRAGDQWTMNYSTDGVIWTNVATFSYLLKVTSVGPFVGQSYFFPVPAYPVS